MSRRLWPRKMISPSTIADFRLIRPMTVRKLTLLPEPDSPTMPSVSPGWIENETPSTALTIPSSVGKWTRRSLTSRSGSAIAPTVPLAGRISRVPHPGVEEGVDDVDHQVGERHEERRHDRHVQDRVQVPPGHGVDREVPETLDVEDGLGDDRPGEEAGQVQNEHGQERGEDWS